MSYLDLARTMCILMTNSPNKLACVAKDPKSNHYSFRQKNKIYMCSKVTNV